MGIIVSITTWELNMLNRPLLTRLFLAAVGVSLWASGVSAQLSPSDRMDVDELKQKLDAGEEVLMIDVREDDAVVRGSIPGSIHIPMGQLERRMKDIPRDVQLVFF